MGYTINLVESFVREGCPCLFRRLTKLYCPGCGGTRAVWYLLHGDIGRSLWYHPLVGYMAAVAAGEFGSWLLARRRRDKGCKASKGGFWGHYEVEVYVGIGIILVNWAVKNGALLIMGVKLIP